VILVALIVAFVFGTPILAMAERLWLVIGASDLTAAGIAHKAQLLALRIPHGFIVQTTDCGDKNNLFAWVAEATASAEAAQAALSRIRETVKDAYVKRCDVKPGTMLALRITAIDSSIADVPDATVNWQDEDRISSVRPLPDGRTLVIARYFANVTDDPLEGRRERVLLVESPDRHLVLEENCINPGSIVTHQRRIAFHCVREQAGDHLLHNVVVFDAAGKKLTEVQRCRDPRWSGERAIVCKAESVRPNGQLELHAKHIELTN